MAAKRKAPMEQLALEDPRKSFTTPEINQMLWNRYTEKGEYVFLFDVPDVVGTGQGRRCDGVALGMWGSTGRLIHGFEVKASRGDWLRELRDVKKADPFIEQCDRWWLVTGHISIAKMDEIPASWGWMVATKSGLRVQRPAAQLPQHETLMKRLFAFGLIRRAQEKGNDAELTARLTKQREELTREFQRELEQASSRAAPELERLRKRVTDFEAASGMALEDWRLGNVGQLARRLAVLKEQGYGSVSAQIDRMMADLQKLIDAFRGVREAFNAPELVGNGDES